MVLTDRQRRELHAGIYEYLLSQGPAFEDAAIALSEADPSCVPDDKTINENDDNDDKSVVSVSSRYSTYSTSSKYSTGGLTVASASSKVAHLPVLERKWTAVPRLQKKIMELEKIIRSNRGIGNGMNGRGMGVGMNGSNGVIAGGSSNASGSGERRMLPRPPCNYELKGHAGVISCVAVHPTFTVAVSGSEDGTIKVCV